MRERQVRAIQAFESAANKLSRVQSRSSPLMETLAGVAVALVVVYGGYRVIYHGEQPGNFFAFITALLLATEPAKRVARLHVDINSSLIGVDMLYQFLDEKTPESRAGRHSGAEDFGGAGRVRQCRFRLSPRRIGAQQAEPRGRSRARPRLWSAARAAARPPP